MVLKIFTRDDGPESRDALELGERVKADGYEVVNYDLDDFATTQMVDLYDIHTSPAMIVGTEDGRVVEIWQGALPTESEIKNLMRI